MATGEPALGERGFDPKEVESEWQAAWRDADAFALSDDVADPTYVLAMFPYTSGNLHMGHVRNYTITDAYARFKRLQGEHVLHPMGWDSFGLPAENAAEQRETNPREWTMECIASMREQMRAMGFGYDWDREVTTCEPEYYRWNQWLFLRFWEHGLVDRRAEDVNWCPSCETVLADEQVEGEAGRCWRCETLVETRELDQWVLTITDYAEELNAALDGLGGWPANVKEMQRNWMGRQEGAAVRFPVDDRGTLELFTTRLDTIHGATFVAISPGHGLARTVAERNEEVAAYIDRAEEADELPETSGTFTGRYARNPATGQDIPIYVADYVLDQVGTGAIYAVPAHDERDHAFAAAHDLPIRQTIEPPDDADADEVDADEVDVQRSAYTDDGILVNSGEFDGLTSEQARRRFVEEFDAERRTEYRLRDWLISRQRYWGTPIPIIECDECGFVPVPEDELPVTLPPFVHTTGNPLDEAREWKHTGCPDCGGDATRETDTMDTFVDSSWYFLRFVSPDLEDAPFDGDRASSWMPVDQYVGGIEHAVMHLLYARFLTKALDDLGLLDGIREPFARLTNQGMVLAADGHKMSKSRGNTVSPQRIVDEYGADTARLFVMEAARPERDFPWRSEGVENAHGFLVDLYELAAALLEGAAETVDDPAAAYVGREIDAAIATVETAYDDLEFNEGLKQIRALVRVLRRYSRHEHVDSAVTRRAVSAVARLLAPVAPHTAEAIWTQLDGDGLVVEADWPSGGRPAGDELERRLIENTRTDIREIIEIAGIDDPERIELGVAAGWKFEAYETARGADGNVVSAVMEREEFRERGSAAADFAQELQGRDHLQEQLGRDHERAALERARWLLEDEFGAEVVVTDHEGDAEPGRPRIEITG